MLASFEGAARFSGWAAVCFIQKQAKSVLKFMLILVDSRRRRLHGARAEDALDRGGTKSGKQIQPRPAVFPN
jgi:hypothetical protein